MRKQNTLIYININDIKHRKFGFNLKGQTVLHCLELEHVNISLRVNTS